MIKTAIERPPAYFPPPLRAADVIASYRGGSGWRGPAAPHRTRRGGR